MFDEALTAAEKATAQMRDLLPQLVEARRQIARAQAHEAKLLSHVRHIADEWAGSTTQSSEAELPHRSTAAEVAAAWRVSDRTVQRRMNDAAALVDDFPATFAAFESGTISSGHARVIVDAGMRIEQPELRAEYEQDVLSIAVRESAGRLGPIAKQRAEWYLPQTVSERHDEARKTRRVGLSDLDDGMTELIAVLPSVLAYGVHDRLTSMARDVAAAERAEARGDDIDRSTDADGRGFSATDPDAGGYDDTLFTDAATAADGSSNEPPRTLDQLRADILADLLLAADPAAHAGTTATGLGAIRGTVEVTVPVLTLLDDRLEDPFDPAMLRGVGPVSPDVARQLAAGAPGWDRVLTDPISCQLLAVDRYTPSAQQKRHLQVRDQHCRFPGCRHSTKRSDIDHTIDRQFGGETEIGNLAYFCRRHHTLKHHSPWAVRQLPGGVLEWTSPVGIRYTDYPVSTVAFAPDAENDPPPPWETSRPASAPAPAPSLS